MLRPSEILKSWKSLETPGGFSSASYLRKGLQSQKKKPPAIGRVKEALRNSVIFQAHRDFREKFSKRADIATAPSERWEVDIADLGAKVTPDVSLMPVRGKRPLLLFLVAVDVFSRKIFARALLSTRGEDVTEAFERIFSSLNPPFSVPREIETDSGTEFRNRRIKEFCKRKGIIMKTARGKNKARMAERAIRSMKRVIMASYQSGNWPRNSTWNEIVNKAAHNLNGRYNRDIKSSPDAAIGEKNTELMTSAWKRKNFVPFAKYFQDAESLERGDAIEEDGSEWRLGDPVLVAIPKQRRAEVRDKEFQMHFRLRPRTIRSIWHAQKPYLYELEDPLTGKPEKKKYYSREFKKAHLPSGVSAEDIVEARVSQVKGLEYLVRHGGWVSAA